MNIEDEIRSQLLESAEVKREAAASCCSDIARAARLIVDCLTAGNKVLFCGNGGSAADSQHLAAELTSVLSKDYVRPGLPAIALTTDSSFLTASANDFGFDGVFARLVEALGRPGDILVAISTSGNSRNVMRAVDAARGRGIGTIGLTGSGGGELATRADVTIRVPSTAVQHIQEAHIAIGHAICAVVEVAVFPREAKRATSPDR